MMRVKNKTEPVGSNYFRKVSQSVGREKQAEDTGWVVLTCKGWWRERYVCNTLRSSTEGEEEGEREREE